ncbi:hypothetical protein [Pontibacter sp. H249]|uniref:hypothetical protein n=1 Tax=Pontibacter sp. H249 TaxID=3133420 RepID=UPI0030BEEDB8
MKTNKSYKEAILRAYPTEKDNTQEQERLLALKQQKQGSPSAEAYSSETPIIETSKNLMRSWLNLRGLDQQLEKGESKNKKS